MKLLQVLCFLASPWQAFWTFREYNELPHQVSVMPRDDMRQMCDASHPQALPAVTHLALEARMSAAQAAAEAAGQNMRGMHFLAI